LDIPRIFTITESAHRIHNPFTPEKLATLGAALRLAAGARVLDLGSGSGEMLCTGARDHGVTGTGVGLSRHRARHGRGMTRLTRTANDGASLDGASRRGTPLVGGPVGGG